MIEEYNNRNKLLHRIKYNLLKLIGIIPENHYKKWSVIDMANIKLYIYRRFSDERIARSLGRTPRSVRKVRQSLKKG